MPDSTEQQPSEMPARQRPPAQTAAQPVRTEAQGGEEEEGVLTEDAAGIIQLANQIIQDAFQTGVSDIHIEPYPGESPTEIRFRLDGACFKYKDIPHTHWKPLVSRIKIMSDLDIAEKRRPQSGKIKMMVGRKDVELRVEATPTAGNREDVVMRILASGKPLPLDRMNFSPSNLTKLMEIIERLYGMILVVGPTGSGKTTTLHSILGHLNRPEVKIWTAEDPVEITQYGLRQVHEKIGFTFAGAMRSFLRADPDIIMVGEMRDAETSEIGIQASLTGHLVLSTLHTNSAPESVTRLIDMGMDPFNFADSLLGILAQRLVRTLCKECKVSYQPEADEFEGLRNEYGPDLFDELGMKPGQVTLNRPNGCPACNKAGYKGRTGIHELLGGSKGIKKLIQSNARVEEIRKVALEEGMRTLKQDGIYKVLKGVTDMQEVRRVCIE
ncbi:GspE/PulE family protein [Thermodesulfobacteriota bacterium]